MTFRRKTAPEVPCKQCGKMFRKGNYNQVFCSKRCCNDFYNDQKAEAMTFYRNHK